MAANEQTKLQINYSAKNGLMVNVYGDSQAEIEALLTNVQDLAPLILSVENTLKSVAPATPVYNPAPVASAPVAVSSGQVETIQDKYGNTWTYGIADAPTCVRGPMVLKQGVSKTGKPYKGFFDPATKGAPKWTGPTPTDLAQTIFTK